MAAATEAMGEGLVLADVNIAHTPACKLHGLLEVNTLDLSNLRFMVEVYCMMGFNFIGEMMMACWIMPLVVSFLLLS
jgi:hypothetical protein